MLLVTLGVLACAHFVVAGGKARWLVAAGALLGLATLCRPVSLYFVIALAPVLWIALGRRGERGAARLRSGLAAWAILGAAYIAVLGPWMMRNFAVAGMPYVTSMQARQGAWYLPRTVGAPLSGSPVGHAVAEAVRDRPAWVKLAGDARAFGRGFVRFFTILGSGEYPLILGVRYRRHDSVSLREARLTEWAAATLRNRSTPGQRAIVLSIIVYLAALYLCAARGLWVALRRRYAGASALLIATIVYFMIATGPIAREIRYRLPALPAIVLFAGLGLTAPWRERQSSRSSEAASRASAA
jgi:hypothetical protein